MNCIPFVLLPAVDPLDVCVQVCGVCGDELAVVAHELHDEVVDDVDVLLEQLGCLLRVPALLAPQPPRPHPGGEEVRLVRVRTSDQLHDDGILTWKSEYELITKTNKPPTPRAANALLANEEWNDLMGCPYRIFDPHIPLYTQNMYHHHLS